MSTATNSKGAKKPKTQNPKRLNQSFRVQILNLWKWHQKYWGGSWPKIEISMGQDSNAKVRTHFSHWGTKDTTCKIPKWTTEGWRSKTPNRRSEKEKLKISRTQTDGPRLRGPISNACKIPQWIIWQLRIEGARTQSDGPRMEGGGVWCPSSRLDTWKLQCEGLMVAAPLSQ